MDATTNTEKKQEKETKKEDDAPAISRKRQKSNDEDTLVTRKGREVALVMVAGCDFDHTVLAKIYKTDLTSDEWKDLDSIRGWPFCNRLVPMPYEEKIKKLVFGYEFEDKPMSDVKVPEEWRIVSGSSPTNILHPDDVVTKIVQVSADVEFME